MRFSAIFVALLISASAFAQPTVTGPSAGVFNATQLGALAPVNPATLSSPIVIYDVTRQSPTVGQVINLTDFSPNAFTAIKSGNPYATNNASELNGTNFWGRVDGSTQYWVTNFASKTQPITWYAVARPRAVSGANYYLYSCPTAGGSLFELGNPTPILSGGTSITGPGSLAVRWYFLEGQLNGASSFLKTNNAVLIPAGNAGTGGLNGIQIDVNGAVTQFAQWDISGFWAFSASESSSTSASVYQWATNRFGSQLQ